MRSYNTRRRTLSSFVSPFAMFCKQKKLLCRMNCLVPLSMAFHLTSAISGFGDEVHSDLLHQNLKRAYASPRGPSMAELSNVLEYHPPDGTPFPCDAQLTKESCHGSSKAGLEFTFGARTGILFVYLDERTADFDSLMTPDIWILRLKITEKNVRREICLTFGTKWGFDRKALTMKKDRARMKLIFDALIAADCRG